MTVQETASALKAIERQTPIPDLIGYLQRETEMTRSTLAAILLASGLLDEVTRNPQQFLDQAVAAILQALYELMVDGIKYEKLAGQAYEMMLFEMQELECYVSRLVTVQNGLYEAVEFESHIEADFARQLDVQKDTECEKIRCGKAHFRTLGVDYAWVTSGSQM